MRPANPAEERVLRAMRQANVITADIFRACMDLLEATEACDKCGGDGWVGEIDVPPVCDKCDGSGQMRVIR